MAGTMSQADLVADLKASLLDAAGVFTADGDADFVRFLTEALADMRAKRPVTRLGEVTLVAGQAVYALSGAGGAYPDFLALKVDLWRDPGRLPRPWEPTYPGPLPRLSAVWDGTAHALELNPAPSAGHVALLGSRCAFWYFAGHVIGADAADTTVAPADRGLLLLRAQAAAMLAMAVRNSGKPVQLRDGLSGAPRNSTPSALHTTLMDLFWRAA